MSRRSLTVRTLLGIVEPAIRSRADRLYVLSEGRPGSHRHKPKITNYYETGLVIAIYEFLLMSPDLAHLEISHERRFPAATRPQQVDIWIKPPNGGRATLIECGDFTPGKVKFDASKMRRLNRKGINWFLAFFRDQNPPSRDPWKELKRCRGRKGSLKGVHVSLDQGFTASFKIRLPNVEFDFGYSLIRIN
jgi:hypothetical protein